VNQFPELSIIKQVRIGNTIIGDGHPVFVIAEIGINHNGDIEIANKLIDNAKNSGCDAVKFQKRNVEKAVPEHQKNILRETPWGLIKYIDYKKKIEFTKREYDIIDEYCKQRDILWTASPWDIDSVDFLDQYNVPFYKVASACITDIEMLKLIDTKNKPVIISTGMSTLEEIKKAVETLDNKRLVILHCNSSYPAKNDETNLRTIKTLANLFPCCPIGYSGHEVGLQVSLAAVALGAKVIERHITLDRAMWGTDQAASVEPHGLHRLLRDIRVIESAFGDGKIQVYESEKPVRLKLRRARLHTK